MKIISVVGARPNFMKIAPFCRAIEEHNRRVVAPEQRIEHLLVHTGQHYDLRMSEDFFLELDIPQPDIHLNIGSGSHAEQVGRTMIEFEQVLNKEKPDWVVVVGDVNATSACAITAKKEKVKLAHIEAGLRSGDMDMPEEINRLVTDRLSDLLFTPDRISSENLRREGVPEERIAFVGNIMIDTLESQRQRAMKLDLSEILDSEALTPAGREVRLERDRFAVITIHRPSNVDDPDKLRGLVHFLENEVCSQMPLVWPVHPRTMNKLKEAGLWEQLLVHSNLVLTNPLGYHSMLKLNMDTGIMLTDSGGLQEECCVLGTPCLTLRWNTERPVTLQENGGASILVGNDLAAIRKNFHAVLNSPRKPVRPELWDGHTAPRIVCYFVQQDSR